MTRHQKSVDFSFGQIISLCSLPFLFIVFGTRFRHVCRAPGQVPGRAALWPVAERPGPEPPAAVRVVRIGDVERVQVPDGQGDEDQPEAERRQRGSREEGAGRDTGPDCHEGEESVAEGERDQRRLGLGLVELERPHPVVQGVGECCNNTQSRK